MEKRSEDRTILFEIKSKGESFAVYSSSKKAEDRTTRRARLYNVFGIKYKRVFPRNKNHV
jgi:hypothetical protein